MPVRIRNVTAADVQAMWEIFCDVVAAEDTLPFTASLGLPTFRSHWLTATRSFVAQDGDSIVGMYRFGPNYPDLGAHVANATYLVRPTVQGRGIGRALVEHSLVQARSEGFAAMQFNYVVSTNAGAIALYEKLGFAIVGRVPKAFRHKQRGLVDTVVMHRFL